MLLPIHDSHRFVTDDWWRDFLVGHVMERGTTPLYQSGDYAGQMLTSVLRDPRSQRYYLKSFRHIVLDKQHQR